jgi:mannose-6-phosphate isomerase-like protein (cupin superfamily)
LSSEAVKQQKHAANEFVTVAPGTHHQFRTDDSPAVALEMYYTEPLSADIVRRNVGGPV